jgi:hypothetical protein
VISDSDYQWLASVEATEAWSFLQSDLRQPGSKIPTSLASLRRLSTNQRQLLEQQLNFAMGSAKRKVRFPDRWFWTQQLFEQASDEWTAEETAKDLPSEETIYDICCGAGVDSVALAKEHINRPEDSTSVATTTNRTIIAVDAAPLACALASLNAKHNSASLQLLNCLFEDVSLPNDVWLHMDPDRRADGERHTHLYDMQPSWEVIADSVAKCRGASIKAAPGFHPNDAFEWGKCGAPTARRWLSRDGSVRQQRLYWRIPRWKEGQRIISAQRSNAPWHHEVFSEQEFNATPNSNPADQWFTPSQDFGGQPIDSELAGLSLGQYIADQDPAVRAAHCSVALARRLQVRLLGNSFGYYHAEARISHPMLRWFRVVDQLPLDKKKLKAYSRAAGVKRWELKSRNIDIDLVKLQKDLIVDEKSQKIHWILLTKVGVKHIAIIAEEANE